MIRQLRKAGEKSIPGARNLNQLLMTLRRTGGIDYLTKFILNASNALNGFDDFGHFLLAQLQITNCVEYDVDARHRLRRQLVRPSDASSAAADGRTGDGARSRPDRSSLGSPSPTRRSRRHRGAEVTPRAGSTSCQRDAGDDRDGRRRQGHQGPPRLPDGERRLMRRGQSPLNAVFRNPTVIGALAVLITILAVFLAYNANNGLPFVPVLPAHRRRSRTPPALVPGNEVRIGGVRVGIVESIVPVARTTTAPTRPSSR